MILKNEEKPLERAMENAFEKIRTVVDADTVIGKPIILEDGTSLVPISRVTLGFLTGGGEYVGNGNFDNPFAGGSGIGASVVPIGFLVKKKEGYKMVNVGDKSLYEKILALVPEALEVIKNGIEKIK